MKDIFECLLMDHAALRQFMAAMVTILGQPHGVGNDDQADFDMQRFVEMERKFSTTLKMHEALEERFLSKAMDKLELKEKLRVQALAAEHQAIDEVFKILASISSLCNGRHVYALRTVMSQAFENMERHLGYEDKELFPALKKRLEMLRNEI